MEVLANSTDLDQTAPLRSSLVWVCTICPGAFLQIFEAKQNCCQVSEKRLEIND